MASLSNSFRLLGRGQLGTVSLRIVPPRCTQAGPVLRRGFASIVQQRVLRPSHSIKKSLIQPNYVLTGVSITRYYSKDSPAPVTEAATSSILPTEEVSSTNIPATASDSIPEAASSTLDAIYTPLQYGDFATLGLSGWSPAGIVRWSMEIINTTTHLPWFWTIIAGTVFWRLVVAPSSVSALRNSSRLQPHQTEIQKIQAEINDAAKKNDRILQQKASLKLKEVYNKAGISVFGGLMMPLVQIPVSLGMFFGVKTMCSTVEQLKWSGLDILPDLTIPDPTWALPLILIALVNVQVSVGAAEMDVKSRPGMAHLMNGLRVLSLLAVGVTASFPAGLLVSLITASACTILQSLFLQYGPLRRYLGINSLPPKSKLPTMRESVDWAIKSLKNKMSEAKELEQHKAQRARASEQVKRLEQWRRK